MVFDLDSGEMVTREEYNKRQNEREEQELEAIGEDEDDYGDEDDKE